MSSTTSNRSIEHISGACERELARLRACRPEMESRIDSAERLLVSHFRAENGSRPIRIRVSGRGHTYTVSSGSRLGRSYTVEPLGWTCDCPSSKTCYHILACWILERVGKPQLPPKEGALQRCPGCGALAPKERLIEIPEDDDPGAPPGGYLEFFTGDLVCRPCFEGAAIRPPPSPSPATGASASSTRTVSTAGSG